MMGTNRRVGSVVSIFGGSEEEEEEEEGIPQHVATLSKSAVGIRSSLWACENDVDSPCHVDL